MNKRHSAPPILITGADGLVGRAICKSLEKEKVSFLPLTRVPSKAIGQQVNYDLSSNVSLPDVIDGPISGVVHLAAAVPMSSAYPDTEKMADLTRQIDANVCDAAKSWGCPVIYASTCGLYNRRKDVLKKEGDDFIIDASTPYLVAKKEGESRFLQYANSIVMRIAGPIGPGQRNSSVVSRFIAAARSGEDICLWGSGRREQNFVDVIDLAKFVSLALKNPVNGVFNVASATPTSMLDLANEVVSVAESGSVVLAGVEDPNELDTAHYDVSRAYEVYGWMASTPLRQSLQKILKEEFRL